MRSAAAAERAPKPDDMVPEDSRFTAGCTSLTGDDVRSVATTASAAGATLQTFDRLLAQLVDSPPEWDAKRATRPAGVEPGFLTALHRVIQNGKGPGDRASATPVSYFYNGTIYDLTVRGIRPLGHVTVGEQTFDQLTRSDLAIRNHKTNEVTRFAVTFVPGNDGECLPIQIFYQPSFWLSVEVVLDESANVPVDPAAEDAALRRIRHICAVNAAALPN
jgi:hypothetical protein